jgi:DNA-directed RNA polymerase subunit M/transcription elongation factor TFIIS
MSEKHFDDAGSLLYEVTSGPVLQLKSLRTGQMFEAKAEHTLTDNEDAGELTTNSRWRNSLANAGADPVNPLMRLDDGCPKCHTKVVAYRQFGENKKVFYICQECGNQWSN